MSHLLFAVVVWLVCAESTALRVVWRYVSYGAALKGHFTDFDGLASPPNPKINKKEQRCRAPIRNRSPVTTHPTPCLNDSMRAKRLRTCGQYPSTESEEVLNNIEHCEE